MISIAHGTVQLLILLRVHVIDGTFQSNIPSGVRLRVYLDNAVPVFLSDCAVIAAFRLINL